MGCPYCFQKEKSAIWSEESIEILKKHFSKTFLDPEKELYLSLFGGEPLLAHDKILNLLKHIKSLSEKNGFKLGIGCTTNGSLLSSEKISALISECGCNTFQVTFDGNKEKHNKIKKISGKNPSFDIIVKTIKNLIHKAKTEDKKITVLIRVNLIDSSPNEVWEIFDNFTENEKNFIQVLFRSVYDPDTFERTNNLNLSDFYREAKKENIPIYDNFSQIYSFCEGDSGNTVNPDLSIWRCLHDLTREEQKIGYINKDGDLIQNSPQKKH